MNEIAKMLADALPAAIKSMKELLESDETEPHNRIRAANALSRAERSLNRLNARKEAENESYNSDR